MRFEPKRSRRSGRINIRLLPPDRFVAGAMDLAMVPAAKRDRELIAHLTAQRPALDEANVVGVSRLAPADQTRMLSDKFNVLAIADPTRLR